MKNLHIIAYVLIIVGALNWGLVGLLDFNLVMTLLGNYPTLEKIVYIAVGLAAFYDAAEHMKNCKLCSKIKK